MAKTAPHMYIETYCYIRVIDIADLQAAGHLIVPLSSAVEDLTGFWAGHIL